MSDRVNRLLPTAPSRRRQGKFPGLEMTNHPVAITGSGVRFSSPDRVTISPMSREMIPEVGKIHVEAFAGYMNTRLGTSYLGAFLNWFLKAERALALVALDDDGKVVGYVLGAPLDYGNSMNRDLCGIAAASVLMRPWLILSKRFWTIIAGRINSTLNSFSIHEPRFRYPEPAMSLVAIGVAPSARGKKIGLSLLRAFEVKARELGIRSLQLTVYPTNAIARKLYESCDWTPVQSIEKNWIEYFRILTDDGNHHKLSAAQS
jgi:ribosomal protein S18 acetylase RimI-like enzyme